MNKKIKLSILVTLVTNSALAITLPIVSCSSASDEDITISSNVGTAITNKLADLMKNQTSYDNQKILYDKWKTSGIDKTLIDEIKPLITSTTKAINNVTLELKEEFPSEGEVIDGGKITFDLNSGYNIIGGVNPINIGSLGISIDKNKLSPILETVDNALDALTIKMKKDFLDGDRKFQENIRYYYKEGKTFGAGVYFEIIKSTINFKNILGEVFNGADVIKGIYIAKELELGVQGTPIIAPDIIVKLKDPYKYDSGEIIISPVEIGIAK
ncbi:MAG: hypothetical protein ACRDCD_01290 [Mycoplasmoidaceae bacterium]